MEEVEDRLIVLFFNSPHIIALKPFSYSNAATLLYLTHFLNYVIVQTR